MAGSNTGSAFSFPTFMVLGIVGAFLAGVLLVYLCLGKGLYQCQCFKAWQDAVETVEPSEEFPDVVPTATPIQDGIPVAIPVASWNPFKQCHRSRSRVQPGAPSPPHQTSHYRLVYCFVVTLYLCSGSSDGKF